MLRNQLQESLDRCAILEPFVQELGVDEVRRAATPFTSRGGTPLGERCFVFFRSPPPILMTTRCSRNVAVHQNEKTKIAAGGSMLSAALEEARQVWQRPEVEPALERTRQDLAQQRDREAELERAVSEMRAKLNRCLDEMETLEKDYRDLQIDRDNLSRKLEGSSVVASEAETLRQVGPIARTLAQPYARLPLPLPVLGARQTVNPLSSALNNALLCPPAQELLRVAQKRATVEEDNRALRAQQAASENSAAELERAVKAARERNTALEEQLEALKRAAADEVSPGEVRRTAYSGLAGRPEGIYFA